MSNFEKWKNLCLEGDGPAAEILDTPAAKEELTAKEMREILTITGEDEYVNITNDKRVVVRWH